MKHILINTFLLTFCFSFLSSNAINFSDIKIRDGAIKIEIRNYEQTKNQIVNLITKWDALLVKENENKFTAKIENTLVIRVPNQNFDSLLNDVIRLGVYLNSKQIKIVDIDKESKDLTERVRIKKELKEKYLKMIRDTKSTLNITEYEKKVEELNTDIESYESKIIMFSEINKSTLTLSIYEQYGVSTTITPESYVTFSGSGMKGMLIKLLVYGILVAILILGAYFWYKHYQREKRRRSSKTKFLKDYLKQNEKMNGEHTDLQ